jgi:hypothetical protein
MTIITIIIISVITTKLLIPVLSNEMPRFFTLIFELSHSATMYKIGSGIDALYLYVVVLGSTFVVPTAPRSRSSTNDELSEENALWRIMSLQFYGRSNINVVLSVIFVHTSLPKQLLAN